MECLSTPMSHKIFLGWVSIFLPHMILLFLKSYGRCATSVFMEGEVKLAQRCWPYRSAKKGASCGMPGHRAKSNQKESLQVCIKMN